MIRRAFCFFAFVFVVFAANTAAWAGSYLDRAALLLDEAHKEGDLLQPRMNNRELVLLIHSVAEARAKAARSMEVPAAVGKVHPHLLLVLENIERAAQAGLERNFKKFAEHINTARDEERIFRSILTELGFSLPDLSNRR